MAYIPDLPITAKLRFMCKSGADDHGHPFFSSEWMKVTNEAAARIDVLTEALEAAEAAYKALMGRDGYETYQALEDRATKLRQDALDAVGTPPPQK